MIQIYILTNVSFSVTIRYMNHLGNLRVVAVGGGAPNKSSAPALIEAVEMSGTEKTRVLIIPTAKVTAEAHNTTVNAARDLYSNRLGIETAVLHEFNVDPTLDQVENEIGNAGVVYISGGDTDRMMKIWTRSGVARVLGSEALEGAVVLSGISAGAIAPFRWGHSDSLSYRPEHSEDWDYIAVSGLDLIPAAITPHYNSVNERLGARADSFRKLFEQESVAREIQTGFGVDNFAAIKIQDGKITPLYSKPDHRVTVLKKDGYKTESHVMIQDDSIKLDTL